MYPRFTALLALSQTFPLRNTNAATLLHSRRELTRAPSRPDIARSRPVKTEGHKICWRMGTREPWIDSRAAAVLEGKARDLREPYPPGGD